MATDAYVAEDSLVGHPREDGTLVQRRLNTSVEVNATTRKVEGVDW